MITEADTCRKYVLPKLYAAGWNDDQISEQKSFTDGRIIVVGNKARRRPSKLADYLLRYARDYMLAVVEAKAAFKLPGDGLQQAKEYAGSRVGPESGFRGHNTNSAGSQSVADRSACERSRGASGSLPDPDVFV